MGDEIEERSFEDWLAIYREIQIFKRANILYIKNPHHAFKDIEDTFWLGEELTKGQKAVLQRYKKQIDVNREEFEKRLDDQDCARLEFLARSNKEVSLTEDQKKKYLDFLESRPWLHIPGYFFFNMIRRLRYDGRITKKMVDAMDNMIEKDLQGRLQRLQTMQTN